MSEQEIEKEIQARVEFKMNELLTGIKNRVGHKYGQAFDMTRESQYKWEAFKEIAEMVKKETEMATPRNNMDKHKKWEAKEKAVANLAKLFDVNRMRDYPEKMKRIVIEVEKAQNY